LFNSFLFFHKFFKNDANNEDLDDTGTVSKNISIYLDDTFGNTNINNNNNNQNDANNTKEQESIIEQIPIHINLDNISYFKPENEKDGQKMIDFDNETVNCKMADLNQSVEW
jgi:hypothetical protein